MASVQFENETYETSKTSLLLILYSRTSDSSDTEFQQEKTTAGNIIDMKRMKRSRSIEELNTIEQTGIEQRMPTNSIVEQDLQQHKHIPRYLQPTAATQLKVCPLSILRSLSIQLHALTHTYQ